MRAFTLDGFDAEPALQDDLPEPSAADDGLLVRVHASSVNPVDAFLASGAMKEMAEYRFPVILGRDFAGVVEAVGPDVSRFRPGAKVFGFVRHANPAVRDGSWAELVAVPDDGYVAAKPGGIDFAAAGAVPLAALTALAAFDALAPGEGENVLVVGAPGGVGTYFVQLAAAAGARIVAPALPEDRDYLRRLGADTVVDRDADLHATVPEGFDAVLDVVSRSPAKSLLKEGGRLASTIGAAGEGPDRFDVSGEPTPENYARLAELLDAGKLRVHVQRTYPLEEAGVALTALLAEHTQGKLGLTIA